jgi:hypothetical protein
VFLTPFSPLSAHPIVLVIQKSQYVDLQADKWPQHVWPINYHTIAYIFFLPP